MDMSGEHRIAAPRQRVWDALNDPSILKQCIEGCEELNRISETELIGRVLAKVGPVKARFNGILTLSDLNPPESYTIAGEGKAGTNGFAKGSATVNLAEDSGATLLRYSLHANVGGKLAQIGARLIAGTAKKTADEFFTRFCALVAPETEPVAGPTGAATAENGVPSSLKAGNGVSAQEQPARRSGLSPMVWIGGVILLVIALVYAFS